ncbi:MAG TPA: hypothetical protein VF518_11275 [Polyangia bacterium]
MPSGQADAADWPGQDGTTGLPANVRVQSNGAACPSVEQVQLALRHAGISDAINNTGWRLAYGAVSSDTGTLQAASVWMDLTSPTGELIARRRLPNDGSDCGAIAGAMSAIVERSLHELGWTRGDPLPGRARPTVPESAPMPTPTPPPPRLIVGLGPALGTSSRIGLNLAIEAQLRVVGSVSLRLGGGLLAKEDRQALEEAVRDGQARSSSRPLSATILTTLLTPKETVNLDVGAVFQASIDEGRSQNLSAPAEGHRAVLAAGLLLGGNIRLSPRWRFALDIQGLRTVAGVNFVVALDNTRRVVLPPPTWQGIVCAKLEFVVWP